MNQGLQARQAQIDRRPLIRPAFLVGLLVDVHPPALLLAAIVSQDSALPGICVRRAAARIGVAALVDGWALQQAHNMVANRIDHFGTNTTRQLTCTISPSLS